MTGSEIPEINSEKKFPRWLVVFLSVDFLLILIIFMIISYLVISDNMLPVSGNSASFLSNFDFFSGLLNRNNNGSNTGGGELSVVNQIPQYANADINNLPLLMNYQIPGGMNKPEYGEPSLNFYDIDFSNDQLRTIIIIRPPDKQVNNGQDIIIPLYPAQDCEFGEKTACVTAYKTSGEGNTIFLSVHSGVGGEAQKFRHAIEGTGINKAGYQLNRVLQNLNALEGAEVVIIQDDVEIEGLRLLSSARVPADRLASYMNTPVTGALSHAAAYNPNLLPMIRPDAPQLVIETCGWKMRGEPWAEEVTPTTASIYLSVIQKTTHEEN